MVGLAGPLLDERHLHHRAFLACTRHVFYFGFVVLFAFGLWQALPIWFALLLSCGLWSVTILVMGACWGLTSLIRNAAAWPEYHFRQDGTHG
jgi:uncharacterized membrane protein (DUF485 family)